jgi:outer membrane receptor for ferric coprogen and ferric-rhodotorulic acid
VNAGYYSRQPFFNSVYPNNKSTVNPNLTNEKIIGFEAGYGFRSKFFNASVNLYNTTWNDRYLKGNALNASATIPANSTYTEFVGLNEVHSGFEFEGSSNITERLKITGMFSYGIWEYKGNATVNAYNQADNTPVVGYTAATVYMDKVKVGDAAQLTASLGASYEVLTRVTIDANYNFNDKLYAGLNPVNFTSLELPSYGLMDAGFSYKMLTGKNKDKSLNFRLNVNNVFNEIYIAEARTNTFADDNLPVASGQPAGSKGTYASNGMLYDGVANVNTVFFGFGRTWNFTLRYDF